MQYLTPLITLKSSSDPGEFILFADFTVRCSFGDITVPRGFITDFASVPRLAQWLPGFNKTEGSANAAVLHDWLYCCNGSLAVSESVDYSKNLLKLNRQQCDTILYLGLRASGYSPLVAGIFYAAVRIGGWLPWGQRKDGLDFTYDFVPQDFDWSKP